MNGALVAMCVVSVVWAASPQASRLETSTITVVCDEVMFSEYVVRFIFSLRATMLWVLFSISGEVPGDTHSGAAAKRLPPPDIEASGDGSAILGRVCKAPLRRRCTKIRRRELMVSTQT